MESVLKTKVKVVFEHHNNIKIDWLIDCVDGEGVED